MTPLPSDFATEPRRHRDPKFLAAKQARWHEPHIAPLNRYVDQIRSSTGLDVPYLDPDSGGVEAKVLFLLEAPARAAAHDSGMLSADNDDGTAANIWRAYQASGMPRTHGLHWNIVPWYVGTTEKLGAITTDQRKRGAEHVLPLLELAPQVRVVVAFGSKARDGVAPIHRGLEERGITLLTSIHPSQRNYNSRRERTTREVLSAFARALSITDGTTSPSRRDPSSKADAALISTFVDLANQYDDLCIANPVSVSATEIADGMALQHGERWNRIVRTLALRKFAFGNNDPVRIDRVIAAVRRSLLSTDDAVNEAARAFAEIADRLGGNVEVVEDLLYGDLLHGDLSRHHRNTQRSQLSIDLAMSIVGTAIEFLVRNLRTAVLIAAAESRLSPEVAAAIRPPS